MPYLINNGQYLTSNGKYVRGANPPPVYDDWYLPERNIMPFMYTNLFQEGIGNLSGNYYWSSSEVNLTVASVLDLDDGNMTIAQKFAEDAVSTRAIRNFTDSVGAYNLGDPGPAGGWIFYISGGTTYYEAAPSDQSTTIAWSTITDTLVGTFPEIGTGYQNTLSIISQHGPSGNSAAKLCNDLVI